MGCISMIVVLLIISGTALLTDVGGFLGVLLWIIFTIYALIIVLVVIAGIIVSILKFFMSL